MKFIFFAKEEFKASPLSLKLAVVAVTALAIITLLEFFTSGLILGIAPTLGLGWGILGFFLSYLIFDSANTTLRKRKSGYGLTFVFALSAIIVGVLSFLEQGKVFGILIAVLGVIALYGLRTPKSKAFLSA